MVDHFAITVILCTLVWIALAAALRWSYVEAYTNRMPPITPEQRTAYARAFMRLQVCTYIKTLRDSGFRNGVYDQATHLATYERTMRRHFSNADISETGGLQFYTDLQGNMWNDNTVWDAVIERKLKTVQYFPEDVMRKYPLRGSLDVKISNECTSNVWGAKTGQGPGSAWEMWRTGQRTGPTPGMTLPIALVPARAEPRCCPCPN
jgi:hypothetical protein